MGPALVVWVKPPQTCTKSTQGIGSGIMGERLSGGNVAIALLGNTLATGAGLIVLITIFGLLSGAHFNPAVTPVFALRREIGWAAQIIGAVLGVWAAHVMVRRADLASFNPDARRACARVP